MMPKILFLSSLLVVGCAPKGSFDGKLVDPVSGKGLAGVAMVLSSPTNPSPACMELEATTADDGSFLIEGLCANGDYTFSARDKTIVLEDIGAVPGGVLAAGTKTVNAWPAAPGDGIFSYDGTDWTKLRTIAKIGLSKIYNSEDKVVYPDTLPTRVVVVPAEKWLVFSGEKFTARHEFEPMYFYDKYLRLGSSKEPERSEPWWYVGTEFSSDTEYTRKETQLDASKVRELDQGDVKMRFISGDGVPNGFYVMYYEGFEDDPRYKKLYMVNMGPALPAPGAE